MVSNRGRDTKPELAVRKLIHAKGLRYRVDMRPFAAIRSRADIVFPRLRIAVYIDGCFWHSCPEHGSTPKTNIDYWGPKLERNKQRDLEATLGLRDQGWTVLRFWEHEGAEEVADEIVVVVRAAAGRI
ncbi:very short patch repair endonuclease [Clavibacter michiganensis]|uniref:very short patch repair endonuclease n=1 Tax=Clavibacter michiganensis TaxID=28447 RepID=UPI000A3C1CA3|nr:very short patch repair endonuclease [Clavibacter michiganensis]